MSLLLRVGASRCGGILPTSNIVIKNVTKKFGHRRGNRDFAINIEVTFLLLENVPFF